MGILYWEVTLYSSSLNIVYRRTFENEGAALIDYDRLARAHGKSRVSFLGVSAL